MESGRGIIVMGVSGAGKSTIGKALAATLGWEFIEGDEYHSAANAHKMHAGIPLDDADRAPWLRALHELIADRLRAGKNFVLACSALKAAYRHALTMDDKRVQFVYLKCARHILAERLAQRVGHFMSPSLLASQLETLEVPIDALVIDVGHATVEQNVAQIRSAVPFSAM